MERESEECCVRVAVHVRPLIEKELAEGCEECVYTRPSEPDVIYARGAQQSFGFDYVFGGSGEGAARNGEHLYETCAQPLVFEVLKGFNATILAYGQTGSGKTYTMGTGDPDSIGSSGVAPRAIRELFQQLAKNPPGSWTAKVSFLELHREDFHDLLSAAAAAEGSTSTTVNGGLGLSVREVPGKGVCIVGAVEKEVRTADEVHTCLKEGARVRATASTEMNKSSSRSHAILTLSVEQQVSSSSADDAQGDPAEDKLLRGKLHLVDLAGSERAKRTKAEGQRFREGVSINKGLLSLGKVISALVDGAAGSGRTNPSSSSASAVHIPYRDSKLTRLLQDSLGGNSRTVMVACISPADVNLDETLNTLKYAARARRIRNTLVQNVQMNDTDAELAMLRQQLQRAREELAQLRGSDVGRLRRDLLASEAENKRLCGRLRSLLSVRSIAAAATAADGGRGLEARDQDLLGAVAVAGPQDDLDWDGETCGEEEPVEDEDGEELGTEGEDAAAAAGGLGVWDDDLDEGASRSRPGHPRREVGGGGGAPDRQQLVQALLVKEMAKLEEELEVKEAEMAEVEQSFHSSGRSGAATAEIRAKYESHIEELEEERNRLRQRLRELEKSQGAVRAEERARSNARLRELEGRISDLRAQLRDSDRLRRERERAEEQHQRLRDDILRIKQHRASIAKQMEQSARQHRDEVRAKEHTIAQLRKQDRRHALHVQRLEHQHQQQSAMLERKSREAESTKRRLREAVARIDANPRGGSAPVQRRERREETALTKQRLFARQLERHIREQTEIAELRRTAEQEQSARAEVAREAQAVRTRGEDDARLQRTIAGHNERIRELQANLVRLVGEQEEKNRTNLHAADDDDPRRWGRIRSAAEARTVLDIAVKATVEARTTLLETQRRLAQKSSELEVAVRRLGVEESARRAREKQISNVGSAQVAIVPRYTADRGGKRRPAPEDTASSEHGRARLPDRRSSGAAAGGEGRRERTARRWLSDDDGGGDDSEDSSSSSSSDDVFEAPDDVDDPEWELANATPILRVRRRKRVGSTSTSASSEEKQNRALPGTEAERTVLRWINEERRKLGEEAVSRVTVPLLKQVLRGRTVLGVPWKAAAKDRASLLSDALSMVVERDESNNEQEPEGGVAAEQQEKENVPVPTGTDPCGKSAAASTESKRSPDSKTRPVAVAAAEDTGFVASSDATKELHPRHGAGVETAESLERSVAAATLQPSATAGATAGTFGETLCSVAEQVIETETIVEVVDETYDHITAIGSWS